MPVFCPQCGQQQVSEEIRFCSRCGLPLTAVSEVLANRGEFPGRMLDAQNKPISPRKRGLKHGLFFFLLSFLFGPLAGFFSMMIGAKPAVMGAVVAFFLIGGLLRMVYALMFESSIPGGATLEDNLLVAKQKFLKKPGVAALPPQQSIPASDYVSPAVSNRRETNELATPVSVTENTTKLLEKDQ